LVLPLALVGCQSRQAGQTANQPQERVAGEREEAPSAEVMAAIQAADLPVKFGFGGRVWRGHQIHKVDAKEVAAKPMTNKEAEGDPDYVPVFDLKVAGKHQIYRLRGADEMMTDNIFLMASTPAGTAAVPETGDSTGDTAGESTDSAANQATFIEYDVVSTPVEDMETADVARQLGLPEKYEHAGKTWAPREVQPYDPDVFDNLKPATGWAGQHMGFMNEGGTEMYVAGEMVHPMPEGSSDPTVSEPGGQTPSATEAPTDDAKTVDESLMRGPVWVKYEPQS
jgi:hypothetical protein